MFMFTKLAHAQNVVKLNRRLMNDWNRRAGNVHMVNIGATSPPHGHAIILQRIDNFSIEFTHTFTTNTLLHSE